MDFRSPLAREVAARCSSAVEGGLNAGQIEMIERLIDAHSAVEVYGDVVAILGEGAPPRRPPTDPPDAEDLSKALVEAFDRFGTSMTLVRLHEVSEEKVIERLSNAPNAWAPPRLPQGIDAFLPSKTIR